MASKNVFVSPTGSAQGEGTFAAPYDLSTGLDYTMPGDTLRLMSGTYSALATKRAGTQSKRITIEPAEGATVVLDGLLDILHDYITFDGQYRVEMLDSGFTDRTTDTEQGQDAVDITGHHVRLINTIIHDFKFGVLAGASVEDLELYGNLIYFCGWDSINGHGVYTQNSAQWKKFINNIIVHNFGYGFHLWGASGDVDYMWLEKNVMVLNGLLPSEENRAAVNLQIGGQTANTGHKVFDNVGYGAKQQIGYGSDNPVTNTAIYDNHFDAPVALSLIECVPDRLDGNALHGLISGFVSDNWPDNNYGIEAGAPDKVILYPNDYTSGFAILIISNLQAEADTVNVDLSALGWTGQVRARNVQDYFTDMQTLDIVDGVITVNMQAINRTVATPQGWAAPETTFPAFGAFVLERVP